MLRAILIWLTLVLPVGAATIGTFDAPRTTLTYTTESSRTNTALGQSFTLYGPATLTAISFGLLGSGASAPASAQIYGLGPVPSGNDGAEVVGERLAAIGFSTQAAPSGTPVVAQTVQTGGILLPAGYYLAILRPLSTVNMSLALLRDGSVYPQGHWARVSAPGNPASLTGLPVLFSQSYDLVFALDFSGQVLPVPLPPGLLLLGAALGVLALTTQGARRRPAGRIRGSPRSPPGSEFRAGRGFGVSSGPCPPSCPWQSRASWRAAFHRPSRSGARRSGGGWP